MRSFARIIAFLLLLWGVGEFASGCCNGDAITSAIFLQEVTDRDTKSDSQKIERLRIPSYMAESMAHKLVLPKDVGIPGEVTLEVLVGTEGRVIRVRGLSGEGRLIRAAKPAVMNWVFDPFVLDAKPVQFVTEFVIQFDGKKHGTTLKVAPDPLTTPDRLR